MTITNKQARAAIKDKITQLGGDMSRYRITIANTETRKNPDKPMLTIHEWDRGVSQAELLKVATATGFDLHFKSRWV